MERFQGVLGIIVIIGVLIALSRSRKNIKWRTLGVGLALQVIFALLVMKWGPGVTVLKAIAGGVQKLTDYTNEGTAFVFGSLMPADSKGFVFALNVLPVIIFLGMLIQALYYLRIIQYVVDGVGFVLGKLLGVSKIEAVWSATVIFLGQSEAPLLIKPYLSKLTKAQLYTCMCGGFASVAGATLIGYSLLGAPLPALLAASLMNAPGSIIVAKVLFPDTEESDLDGNVRNVRDEESHNFIDALSRGAMAGGRIAIAVACMLIAFIALIHMCDGIIGCIGGWFGQANWSLEGFFGLILSPFAWLIGVPWHEAPMVANFIGQKTVLNEFVGYTALHDAIEAHKISSKSLLLSTFALAGFANFGSIAIQIGTYSALVPERRAEVAKLAPMALFGGFCVNMLNAAIVGVVAS